VGYSAKPFDQPNECTTTTTTTTTIPQYLKQSLVNLPLLLRSKGSGSQW